MTNFIEYLITIGPLEWVGVTGAVCYVTAFGSVQLGQLDGNSTAYSLANILAATLVAISLFAEFNLASALIQSCWIIAGVTGMALRANRSWPAAREVLDTTLENGAR